MEFLTGTGAGTAVSTSGRMWTSGSRSSGWTSVGSSGCVRRVHAWIHVARGSVSVNGTELDEGDGAAVSSVDQLDFLGRQAAEVLVFDLA